MLYRRAFFFALFAVLLAAPVTAQHVLGDCVVGSGFGSTLLIPYFEVDLSNPNSLTTQIAVNNALDSPTLVRVVLWTDWGVPTLAFDVYLEGYAVGTLNARSIFNGNVPSTGEGADLSGFPFCDMLPPFHDNPILTATDRAQLEADHRPRQA